MVARVFLVVDIAIWLLGCFGLLLRHFREVVKEMLCGCYGVWGGC